jgi:CMP/dCMP kinase
MSEIVVAVDGPAGSGKSSVARDVALRLGLKYVDSGALYRAVTLHAMSTRDKVTNDLDFTAIIGEITLDQRYNIDGTCTTFLNGDDVSEDIRTENIAANIGIVSDQRVVRNYINNHIRSWAADNPIIIDGRDIGTVVFPDATLKVYLDASVDERTRRRLLEYREKGKDVDVNSIKSQIILRDQQDENRPFGALKKANDARYLDTSNYSREEVVTILCDMINAI